MSSVVFTEIAATTLIVALLFGYLCGSVPFGLVLTKIFDAGDLRSIGSGNIGATNVLRTGRKDLAAATLLLDALKGTFAVFVGSYFGPGAALAAGVGAFLGHIFPVWLKFKGGKGVATFLGVALGLDWRCALAFAVAWLAVAFTTRYSSLAALVACLVTPLVFFLVDPWPYGAVMALLTLLSFWKHRENIERLRAGTESKIGQKG